MKKIILIFIIAIVLILSTACGEPDDILGSNPTDVTPIKSRGIETRPANAYADFGTHTVKIALRFQILGCVVIVADNGHIYVNRAT